MKRKIALFGVTLATLLAGSFTFADDTPVCQVVGIKMQLSELVADGKVSAAAELATERSEFLLQMSKEDQFSVRAKLLIKDMRNQLLVIVASKAATEQKKALQLYGEISGEFAKLILSGDGPESEQKNKAAKVSSH